MTHKKERRHGNLEKILAESPMPAFVRITKRIGIPDTTAKVSLARGNILMLHFTFDRPIVHAKNSQTGRLYRLPLQAQQEYELLPLDPSLEGKEYNGTKELIEATPLPKCVRVTQPHCSALEIETQEEGDVIEELQRETHKELGKILVGKVSGSTVRLTRSMNFSKYSTMVSPHFLRLADIIHKGFPQRVRVPDLTLGEKHRTPTEEMVLELTEHSDVTYVLATRLGDTCILTLPVNTQLPLEVVPPASVAASEEALTAVAALYPMINPTWKTVDPSHPYLSPEMVGIPQPIEGVLRMWLSKSQGRQRTRAEAIAYKQETDAEISSLSAEIDRLEIALSAAQKSTDVDDSAILNEGSDSKPSQFQQQRALVSELSNTLGLDQETVRPRSNAYFRMYPRFKEHADIGPNEVPNYTNMKEDVNDDESEPDDDYETFDDDPDLSEEEHKDMLTKHREELERHAREFKELNAKYNQLWHEFETVLKEKSALKSEKYKLIREIEGLQCEIDYGTDYCVVEPPMEDGGQFRLPPNFPPRNTNLHLGDQIKSETICDKAENKSRPLPTSSPPLPSKADENKTPDIKYMGLPPPLPRQKQKKPAVIPEESQSSLTNEVDPHPKPGTPGPVVKPKPTLPVRNSQLVKGQTDVFGNFEKKCHPDSSKSNSSWSQSQYAATPKYSETTPRSQRSGQQARPERNQPRYEPHDLTLVKVPHREPHPSPLCKTPNTDQFDFPKVKLPYPDPSDSPSVKLPPTDPHRGPHPSPLSKTAPTDKFDFPKVKLPYPDRRDSPSVKPPPTEPRAFQQVKPPNPEAHDFPLVKQPYPEPHKSSSVKPPPPERRDLPSVKPPPSDPRTLLSAKQPPPPDPHDLSLIKRPPPERRDLPSVKPPPPDPRDLHSVKPPPREQRDLPSVKLPPPEPRDQQLVETPPPDPRTLPSVKLPPPEPLASPSDKTPCQGSHEFTSVDIGYMTATNPPPTEEIHNKMTTEEVVQFLDDNGLGQYSATFKMENINGDLLFALDEQIMVEDLGFSKLHARKLFIAIKAVIKAAID